FISNPGGAGVSLSSGSTVVNEVDGTISGSQGAVFAGPTGTVTNAGDMLGTIGTGIVFDADGTVVNQSTRTISGTNDGIYIKGGAATVTNAGAISGTT